MLTEKDYHRSTEKGESWASTGKMPVPQDMKVAQALSLWTTAKQLNRRDKDIKTKRRDAEDTEKNTEKEYGEKYSGL